MAIILAWHMIMTKAIKELTAIAKESCLMAANAKPNGHIKMAKNLSRGLLAAKMIL